MIRGALPCTDTPGRMIHGEVRVHGGVWEGACTKGRVQVGNADRQNSPTSLVFNSEANFLFYLFRIIITPVMYACRTTRVNSTRAELWGFVKYLRDETKVQSDINIRDFDHRYR